MDIYKFIESKDVREYFKSQNYQFTAAQAVYIVYLNDHILLADKLTAWQEIIDTMPDCEFPEDDPEIGRISTHDFLREYIAVQRKLMDMYLRAEENAGYGMHGDEPEPDLVQAITALAAVEGLGSPYYIYKVWNGTEKRLCAVVNDSGEILKFFDTKDDIFTGEERENAIYHYCISSADLPLTKLYKHGDIVQGVDELQEVFIVNYIDSNGKLYGYSYRDAEESSQREIENRFSYWGGGGYGSPVLIFELCDEEKAERVRGDFRAWIAKMQDIAKEWE